MVHFIHTRFIKKETSEVVYLLDRAMELGPHVRLSEDVEEKILENATEENYRKVGKELGAPQQVSAESVMRHVKKVEIPKQETVTQKRKAEILYVEADEDHIHRQKDGKGEYSYENGEAHGEGAAMAVHKISHIA